MSFISFPLRFRHGFLLRTSEAEAIVNLLRLMATTPGGSWAGSANFGVRDIFEQGRVQADAHKIAMERMNRALIDLGIRGYRVDSVEKDAASNRDVDNYVVTLVSSVESSKTYSGALIP